MNTTKKILAFLIAVVMVLALAACGEQKPVTSPTGETGNVTDPRVYGMLVFSSEASVNISYDDQGLVLSVEGANTEGTALAESLTDVVGMTCTDLVVDLLKKSAAEGTVTETVILKQSLGSQLPNADFLNTLVSKAQAAADEDSIVTTVIQIPVENLDENGYINLDTAKTLLLQKLGLEKAATLDGAPSPDVDGNYMLYLEEGNIAGTFQLNAVTGSVREMSEDELRELEGITGENEIPLETDAFDNIPTSSGNASEETSATTLNIPDATEGSTEPSVETSAVPTTTAPQA